MLSVKNNISLVEIIVAADDFGLPKVIEQLEKHLFQNGWVRTISPFGLVLSEGALWRKHRKLFGKGFSFQRIENSI